MSTPEDIQQWHVTEPYVDLHCGLGEGPYYEKATQTLRFVDIKEKRIHTVSVTDGPASLTTLQLDERPTVTANVAGLDPQQKLLVGLKYGIALLDRPTGRYEYLARFTPAADNARLRSNDGAADPHGRFWLGTMTDFDLGDFQPEGSLYLFTPTSPSTPPSPIRTNLTIPNSVGWSPDRRTMYFTHSSARTVFAIAYDPETGALGDERVFYAHDGPGEPDGFRVDADGNVWHAVYGEAAVLKISPEGRVVGRVNLPTRNATCVEFVGTELFVTTAGDEEGEGESKRFGGGLFRVEVGVRGVEHFEVRL